MLRDKKSRKLNYDNSVKFFNTNTHTYTYKDVHRNVPMHTQVHICTSMHKQTQADMHARTM